MFAGQYLRGAVKENSVDLIENAVYRCIQQTRPLSEIRRKAAGELFVNNTAIDFYAYIRVCAYVDNIDSDWITFLFYKNAKVFDEN